MYELNRILLRNFGPRDARYEDVPLDFSGAGAEVETASLIPDAGHVAQRPAPASLVMLQNGGGKGVLEVISFGMFGRLPVWGSLSGWCRMSCGSCSSGWCRRRRVDLREVAGVGTGIGRCWPRSCSWPRRAARGSSCPPPRSDLRERQPTGVSPSGPRPGCGRSSIAWSWTNSVPAGSWTGPAV